MFYVVILICAHAVPVSECDEKTSRLQVRSDVVRHELACGVNAQAFVATSSLKPEPDEYLKVVCRRKKGDQNDKLTHLETRLRT